MLEVSGYQDYMGWTKVERDGTLQKVGEFPITRYDNVLNRPKVFTPGTNLVDQANNPFNLVATDEFEVADDKVFDLFGQIW